MSRLTYIGLFVLMGFAPFSASAWSLETEEAVRGQLSGSLLELTTGEEVLSLSPSMEISTRLSLVSPFGLSVHAGGLFSLRGASLTTIGPRSVRGFGWEAGLGYRSPGTPESTRWNLRWGAVFAFREFYLEFPDNAGSFLARSLCLTPLILLETIGPEGPWLVKIGLPLSLRREADFPYTLLAGLEIALAWPLEALW